MGITENRLRSFSNNSKKIQIKYNDEVPCQLITTGEKRLPKKENGIWRDGPPSNRKGRDKFAAKVGPESKAELARGA
jgi:hypothetical protein